MNELLRFLIDPLSYPFMVRGLIAVIVVGAVSAIVGTYVVLRGMAFFGDALAHAILPGVAVGYLVGGGARSALFWWAMLTAVLVSFDVFLRQPRAGNGSSDVRRRRSCRRVVQRPPGEPTEESGRCEASA